MRLQYVFRGVLVASMAFVAACGDEHDHDDHHSAAEEACEHTKEGPFVDVTATAASDGAPDATHAHTAVNVTLVADAADATSNSGFVTFAADEATEFAFFLSADVPFAITDASGNAVDIEESADVAECTEVAKQHNADLEVGTYTLSIGPTSETMVSLVVEEAAHEGDDH